jgi:hypothetical protein
MKRIRKKTKNTGRNLKVDWPNAGLEWTFRPGFWRPPISRPSILHQDLC